MSENYKVVSDTHEEMVFESADNDDPYDGSVYGGGGETVTRVTGPLADRVLARLGMESGDVDIVERYELTGYCYTCAGEDRYFDIRVDGDTVFTPERWEVYSAEVETLSGYAEFQNWLEGAK